LEKKRKKRRKKKEERREEGVKEKQKGKDKVLINPCMPGRRSLPKATVVSTW